MPPYRVYSEAEEILLGNDFDIYKFLGWSWVEIALEINVSIRTLTRIRERIGYISRLASIIDDADVDDMVRKFNFNHPETGKFILLSTLDFMLS